MTEIAPQSKGGCDLNHKMAPSATLCFPPPPAAARIRCTTAKRGMDSAGNHRFVANLTEGNQIDAVGASPSCVRLGAARNSNPNIRRLRSGWQRIRIRGRRGDDTSRQVRVGCIRTVSGRKTHRARCVIDPSTEPKRNHRRMTKWLDNGGL